MSRNRASKAELTQRRHEIQELIIKGKKHKDILDLMSEKWKTSKRAIEEDITKIGKDWQDRATEDLQEMRNKYAERLEWLFCTAMEAGHIKHALDVQKEIHKLNGVYEDKEKEENKMPQFVNIGRRSSLKVVNDENG